MTREREAELDAVLLSIGVFVRELLAEWNELEREERVAVAKEFREFFGVELLN